MKKIVLLAMNEKDFTTMIDRLVVVKLGIRKSATEKQEESG